MTMQHVQTTRVPIWKHYLSRVWQIWLDAVTAICDHYCPPPIHSYAVFAPAQRGGLKRVCTLRVRSLQEAQERARQIGPNCTVVRLDA